MTALRFLSVYAQLIEKDVFPFDIHFLRAPNRFKADSLSPYGVCVIILRFVSVDIAHCNQFVCKITICKIVLILLFIKLSSTVYQKYILVFMSGKKGLI